MPIQPNYSVKLSQDNIKTNYKITVSQEAGVLRKKAPLSLRNVGKDVINMGDIVDIVIVNKTDGSSIQYNADNDKYEIKLSSLDGGTF